MTRLSEHIVVLGGGVIGLSCAYELRKRGCRVTLIEKGACGGQASGAAAGMLAPYTENGEQPDPFFELCLESLRLYPDWQREIREISGIGFEYAESGSLTVFYHEADVLAMRSRQTWQAAYGADAELLDAGSLHRIEPQLSRSALGALYSPREAHLYAPDYVRALERACRNAGVTVRDHAGDVRIGFAAGGDGVEARLADGVRVLADRLVVCTGAWTREWEQAFGLTFPVYPIRGQICAYACDEPPLAPVRHMVFCSQGYVVSKSNGTLVCGASEDVAGFDTSVTDKGIVRLERWNRKLLPVLERMKPIHRWAGLRPATQDGWPLIGTLPNRPSVVMAAGHYRNGILLSPATARVVADLIAGGDRVTERVRSFAAAFAPDRFHLSGVI